MHIRDGLGVRKESDSNFGTLILTNPAGPAAAQNPDNVSVMKSNWTHLIEQDISVIKPNNESPDSEERLRIESEKLSYELKKM